MKIKITKGGMKCCGVALVADLMAFSVSFISFKTIELSIVRTLVWDHPCDAIKCPSATICCKIDGFHELAPNTKKAAFIL